MNVIIKAEDTEYQVPLTKTPLTDSEISKFDKNVDLLNSVLPTDQPGKLTINDVQYNVYRDGDINSSVPSTSGTTYSHSHSSNNVVGYYQTYTTTPVTFSDDEKKSLVKILRKLAQNSHTHGSSESGADVSTSTDVTSNEYYCTDNSNHSNFTNRGNHCDDGGWW